MDVDFGTSDALEQAKLVLKELVILHNKTKEVELKKFIANRITKISLFIQDEQIRAGSFTSLVTNYLHFVAGFTIGATISAFQFLRTRCRGSAGGAPPPPPRGASGAGASH